MSRYAFILRSSAERARAMATLVAAPWGTRVEIKAAKRSLPQNDKMWACLTDVAQQVVWHGKRLRPDDFKLIFLDALKREGNLVPNIDGTGFVDIGRSSSDLTKGEMSDLIEVIHAFGAQHGVVFAKDEEQVHAA